MNVQHFPTVYNTYNYGIQSPQLQNALAIMAYGSSCPATATLETYYRHDTYCSVDNAAEHDAYSNKHSPSDRTTNENAWRMIDALSAVMPV